MNVVAWAGKYTTGQILGTAAGVGAATYITYRGVSGFYGMIRRRTEPPPPFPRGDYARWMKQYQKSLKWGLDKVGEREFDKIREQAYQRDRVLGKNQPRPDLDVKKAYRKRYDTMKEEQELEKEVRRKWEKANKQKVSTPGQLEKAFGWMMGKTKNYVNEKQAAKREEAYYRRGGDRHNPKNSKNNNRGPRRGAPP